MSEKHKYLNIYSGEHSKIYEPPEPRGKIGGGYGRICWGEGMLELMKNWKVDSLLDVGCGYGNFCDAATLFASRVYGLDIASVATGNVVDNADIEFFDGEANSLPLEDNSVEWVTSFDCLEHCLEEDIDQILSEFDRVSTKGFALSISYDPCDFEGVELHMTVKPESWWFEKLSRFGEVAKEGHVPITGVPYLICRKPVTPKLICYCTGGLGLRIQTLAACDGLAARTGRKLSVVWPEGDPLCPVHFSELFTNTIEELSDDALLSLPSCKIYADLKDVANQSLISGNQTLRTAVRKWGCTETNSVARDDDEDNIIVFIGSNLGGHKGIKLDKTFLKRLEPVDHLRDRIDDLIHQLGIDKNVMGVHARGTDFGIGMKTYAQTMINAIEQNPALRFLVCSDDEVYEQQLKQVFQEKVITRPKTDWIQKIDPHKGWALGNVRISKEALYETFVDLYLLGRTDFRIYHESSIVARLCKILSNGHGISKDLTQSTLFQPGMDSNVSPSLQASLQPQCATSSETMSAIMPTMAKSGNHTPSIYFFCPDTLLSSAGIRRLYRHVKLLHNAGYQAYIVHEQDGFKRQDMAEIPLTYVHQIGPEKDAVFVIPEGMPSMMQRFKDHPGRRFVIALNWHYIFGGLPDHLDWRHLNIERVLVVSPVIGQMVSWAMGLPVHLLGSSIDHGRYHYDPAAKRPRVSFIQRKAVNIDRLKRLVGARNPDFVNNIQWVGLDGLSEDAYAKEICTSSVFLNTSMAEGLPTSSLEAMAAGTIVAGYDSVGGRTMLTGNGPMQNCILAPNGDYVSLAYALEPVLSDLVQGQMEKWAPIVANACNTASQLTLESESASLTSFWKEVCSTA